VEKFVLHNLTANKSTVYITDDTVWSFEQKGTCAVLKRKLLAYDDLPNSQ